VSWEKSEKVNGKKEKRKSFRLAIFQSQKRLVLGSMSSCWEGKLDACGFDL